MHTLDHDGKRWLSCVDMARPRGFRMSPTAWRDITTVKRLSLTEVAEISQVNRATISGLVGGHARASMPIARQISDALEVSPETLFPTMQAAIFSEVA